MTRAEVQRKAAKAKKTRLNHPTLSAKKIGFSHGIKKNELQLTKDKVNRWAREIAQGRKSNAQ